MHTAQVQINFVLSSSQYLPAARPISQAPSAQPAQSLRSTCLCSAIPNCWDDFRALEGMGCYFQGEQGLSAQSAGALWFDL